MVIRNFYRVFILYSVFKIAHSTASSTFKDEAISSPDSIKTTEEINLSDPYDSIKTNGILIFIDDLEYFSHKINASSESLLSALNQNAGPLITSRSLLRNISILEKAPVSYEKACENLTSPTRKNFLLNSIGFDKSLAEKWIIKELGEGLCLLIPETYLIETGLEKNEIEKTELHTKLTPAELSTGLKINHLKTLSFDDIYHQPIPSYISSFALDSYFINEALARVFVTKQDYRAAKIAPSNLSQWVIFLCGHGSFELDMITGLRFTNFQRVLSFFQNQITTKLLVYLSCYSGKFNEILIKKDLVSGIYSFPLMSLCLTDAPTFSNPLRIIPPHQLLFGIDFSLFLKLAKKNGIIEYQKLAECIVTTENSRAHVSSLAQIKFPGISWFCILEDDVISIGSVLAHTRKQPLSLAHFKKPNPLAILLYTSTIPFEIIIDTPSKINFPFVVSMIPGKVVHFFKKITIPKPPSPSTFLEKIGSFFKKSPTASGTFLNKFLPMFSSLKYEKIFIIETLLLEETQEITHIIIHLTQDKEVIVFFTKNNLIYVKKNSSPPYPFATKNGQPLRNKNYDENKQLAESYNSYKTVKPMPHNPYHYEFKNLAPESLQAIEGVLMKKISGQKSDSQNDYSVSQELLLEDFIFNEILLKDFYSTLDKESTIAALLALVKKNPTFANFPITTETIKTSLHKAQARK